MKNLTFTLALFVAILSASGCGKTDAATDTTADSSSSGSVAGAIGGALGGSSTSGTQAFLEPVKTKQSLALASLLRELSSFESHASASTTCPMIPTGGSGCAVVNNTATLTYSECSFPGSGATWEGAQIVAFSGAAPVCGSSFPTGITQIIRTFASGTKVTGAAGNSITVDATTTSTCSDYSGSDCVFSNGGGSTGGATIGFTNGARSSINLNGYNLVAKTADGITLFNHSVTTPSPLTITGDGAGTATVNGTVNVYHNLAHVKGTTTLTNLEYTHTCCTPVSGQIQTVFATGGLLAKFNGATETLVITGCGTGTYTGPEGYSGNVTLGNCF